MIWELVKLFKFKNIDSCNYMKSVCKFLKWLPNDYNIDYIKLLLQIRDTKRAFK